MGAFMCSLRQHSMMQLQECHDGDVIDVDVKARER